MQVNTAVKQPAPAEAFLAARTCPNCSAKGNEPAEVVASIPAENVSYDELSQAWRGFFKESCFFSYVRCPACEQLFAPQYPTESALGLLYKEMGDNTHSGDEHLSRMTQEEYCRTAMRYLPQATTYCEIGPDIGLFLQSARKTHRALAKALLIEPNQTVWPRLYETAKGLETSVASSLEECRNAVADNSLDLIVAIHVLDHLRVPSETLAWIRQKLSPRGIAVFVVHDERSLLARILGARFPAYCPQHPHLYNTATLRQTLARQGLNVKEISRTANYFPVNYLLSHALFALTKKRFAISWPTWPLRLKLGNIIAIAAKDTPHDALNE